MRDHRFKSYDPDQLLLLPPDMRDWLPEDHLAWFVRDVVEQLDLTEIIREYSHLKGGRPGFHPVMMVKLLLYAYCVGVPSSRQIEKKTYEDVAFRVLASGYHPDHAAIAKFRKRHLDYLRFTQSRIEKIRAAKVGLEERERREASEKTDDNDPSGGADISETSPPPDPKTQYNFTDPDSRIMLDNASKSFEQDYNGQIETDCDSQIILACDVFSDPNDKQLFIPMFDRIEQNTGHIPDVTLADAGYFSRANAEYGKSNWTEPLIPSKRQKHSDKPEPAPRGRIPGSAGVVERMHRKLKNLTGRQSYSKRKQSVEPVFGQIKHVRGFRQFLLRGLDNVRAEWHLICLSHNILKMWRSGRGLPIPA